VEDADLNVPKFPVVMLDEGNPQNKPWPLPGLSWNEVYMIIGEVAQEGRGIEHYILMDFKGNVIPGMYHADRFRFATDREF